MQLFEHDSVADDEQIHIARGMRLAARDRSIDQGEADSIGQWFEREPNRLGNSGSLGDDFAELVENRRFGVGLQVPLPAYIPLSHEPAFDQTGDLALDRSRPRFRQRNELARVVAAVGPAEQELEQLELRGRE